MSKKPTDERHAEIRLSVYGEPVTISVNIPTRHTTTRRMLPIFREACHRVVEGAVNHAENNGRTVSCKAGCGACCRQLVPIAPSEAHLLKELVNDLPPDRKAQIEGRFENARSRLEQAGLLQTLSAAEKPVDSEYKRLGLEYFALGVPCPFLENESCSIHQDRPLVCREYLVVSPAENCARTNGEPIEVLKIPGKASKALLAIDDAEDKKLRNWVPLVLALEWAEKNPKASPARPGTEIAERFIRELAGTNVARTETE